ncbi:MAG TPA: L-dopachrome tautomerase-related protein [Candidatus Limnocylindria bacterium]|nr:L-dopachrome tautomerase-related protein [Candidatus Limnocylindria bacterium]
MRRLLRLLRWLVVLLVVAAAATYAFLGGGMRMPDASTQPMLGSAALEKVVDLSYPPGNIAVSRTGRVFFTYHPDGHPPAQVMELRGGQAEAYPNLGFPLYQSVLALRIDRQDRLWALDHAHFGRGRPRIMAFDLATNQLVHRYDFPSSTAGFLSMLNDFQVSPDGKFIYIAEASPIIQRPAIIVYDVERKTSRRVLEGHRSVKPLDYVIQAPGRDMTLFWGLYTLRIGVDSIALDRKGEWLYYGPVNGDRLFRVRTSALRDEKLTPGALGAVVEDFARKTISDGLTTDESGTIYVTDPEHSAIHLIAPDGKLRTLVRDARLRWPDGLSFGPDGYLYVTCSALADVLFVSAERAKQVAPFQIFRIKTQAPAAPGQ